MGNAAESLHVVDQVVHRPPAGAAGAVEAIFSILAMRDQRGAADAQPGQPVGETEVDLVPHTARKKEINTVLSNSFGFGGTNASLVFRRADA
jgi:3-oxoacyl-[acyl-carrier-protein] synthase II